MLHFWKNKRCLKVWLNKLQDIKLVDRSKICDAKKQKLEFYSMENLQ